MFKSVAPKSSKWVRLFLTTRSHEHFRYQSVKAPSPYQDESYVEGILPKGPYTCHACARQINPFGRTPSMCMRRCLCGWYAHTHICTGMANREHAFLPCLTVKYQRNRYLELYIYLLVAAEMSQKWSCRDLLAQIELGVDIASFGMELKENDRVQIFWTPKASFSTKSKMTANRKWKWHSFGSPWSNFSNCSVYMYNGILKGSELIELIFEMIWCQGHSQTVIFKVKYEIAWWPASGCVI